MPIPVVCPSCATKLRASDNMAGCKAKCPKCGAVLAVPKPGAQFAHPPLPRSVTSPEPTPEAVSVQRPEDFDFDFAFAADANGSLPASGESRRKSVRSDVLTFQQLDTPTRIAALVAIAGLLLLAISPLFHWVNLASGGVIGLKGDGKIVLAITVVAIAICVAVMIKPRWLMAGVFTVQAWGTIAVFWMAALIYKVGSIFDSADLKDNPFAGLLATQISPGAGLYLGLISALAVAAALGFVAVHRSVRSDSLWLYFGMQSLSAALGILLAFFVLTWPFFGTENAADRTSSDLPPPTKWKRNYR